MQPQIHIHITQSSHGGSELSLPQQLPPDYAEVAKTASKILESCDLPSYEEAIQEQIVDPVV